MDKDPGKTGGDKSDSVPPEAVIKEVIQSIEAVDRKIEEFLAIHSTDLITNRENRPDFRRGK
jgi:hypothetical protein